MPACDKGCARAAGNKDSEKKEITVSISRFILLKNESDFMLSKTDKSFLFGVVLAVLLALVLNLFFKLNLPVSVVAGILVGVISGILLNKLQK